MAAPPLPRGGAKGSSPLGGHFREPCRRIDLQTKFTDAWIEINRLIEISLTASSMTTFSSCVTTAQSLYNSEVLDLTPQREHATDKVEEAGLLC